MGTTEVIILFVGLTTFTASVPNDCGPKAILPRVVHQGPIELNLRTAQNFSTGRTGTTGTIESAPQLREAASPPQHQHPLAGPLGIRNYNPNAPHVENHSAVLIFESASYIASPNWPRQTLPAKPGEPQYSYVLLDGDRVSFVTPGVTNPQASLPSANLLPNLPAICNATNKLRRDYLPPYTGASAVFNIPEGALQSCLSTAQHPPYGQRIDTKVTLQTDNVFVISASTMKLTKDLRLKPGPDGRIRVAVANIPTKFLAGIYTEPAANAPDGLPHVHAYYAMGEGNTSACSKTLKQWFSEKKPPLAECGATAVFGSHLKTDQTAPQIDFLPPSMASAVVYNFECSNTQWP